LPSIKEHLVAKRREGLKKEYPKMRHEIVGHAVVGVVEQNSPDSFSFFKRASFGAYLTDKPLSA
jgi:hypothetical protein